MRKKFDSDILSLFKDFQRNVLDNKPSSEKMFNDVRMMKFKIRPLQGDISLLNLNDKRLIEILWSLGKLDEFFQREFKRINPKKKEIFFRFFDNIHRQFQDQLSRLNLKPERLSKLSAVLEMEIFKERLPTKKFN